MNLMISQISDAIFNTVFAEKVAQRKSNYCSSLCGQNPLSLRFVSTGPEISAPPKEN